MTYYFYKMDKDTSPIDLTSVSEVVAVYSLSDTQVIVLSKSEGTPDTSSYPDVTLVEEVTEEEAETLLGYVNLTLGGSL